MPEQDFLPWLLSASTPSIRYRTLTEILGRSPKHPLVVKARNAIRKSGPVPVILSHQTKAGCWKGEHSYYTPKYLSTHWSLMLLAELAVDGNDPRFRQGVRFMLDATAGELHRQLEERDFKWSCFWGNLLRYGMHSGERGDPRLADIARYLALDLQDGPCHCEHNYGSPCAWGAARSLWGLAAIPAARRSREVRAAIRSGKTFLVDSHRLVKADYPPGGVRRHIDPRWFKLNFPLFYSADILFTLRVLGELGFLKEPGAQPALDWLEARRKSNGRWTGGSPFRRRTWSALGGREETDRWVSLHAFRILRQAGRLPAPR